MAILSGALMLTWSWSQPLNYKALLKVLPGKKRKEAKWKQQRGRAFRVWNDSIPKTLYSNLLIRAAFIIPHLSNSLMYIWLLGGNNRLIKQFPSYSERTLIYMLLILFFCLVLWGRWAAISLFTAVAACLLLFTCSLRQQIWSTVWWIRRTKANEESAAEVLSGFYCAYTLRFLTLWFHFRYQD